uniref:Purine nucleoside phosphorylase LACC1 n=1 Tax=Tetraodon nigroviridis TaxID=99883 RepID=H3DPZ0_TETNG
STAERLFRFKQSLDALGLSSVRVLTTARGQQVLSAYQKELFTHVYSFEYQVSPADGSGCPSCADSAPDSPEDGQEAEQVCALLRTLPALKGDLRVLRSALIPDCFGHGFSTRAGGVSYLPTLSALNLFSSQRRRDPRAVVQENRRRLALHAGFHPRPLRLVKVDHGRDVWVLGTAEPHRYDAMVTDRAGVVLAAPGADCMPILLADPRSKVIAVAHAGWKGTLLGIAMATVATMVTEFGCHVTNVVVVVGPSVGVCCFKLARDRALDFSRIHPDCVPDPESSTPHVNIRLANSRVLLERGGVLPENIHDDTVTDRPGVTPCTCCQAQDFFSHVRDGADFGTQLGFLWIRD